MKELVRLGYAAKKMDLNGHWDGKYVASVAGARFMSLIFASSAPHPYKEEPPPGPFDYVELRLLDEFLRDFLRKTEQGLLLRRNLGELQIEEPGDAWLERVLERREILDDKLFFFHRRMREHEREMAAEKWISRPDSARKERRLIDAFGQFMNDQQTKWILRESEALDARAEMGS